MIDKKEYPVDDKNYVKKTKHIMVSMENEIFNSVSLYSFAYFHLWGFEKRNERIFFTFKSCYLNLSYY